MTARLVLESPRGVIDLDGVAKYGRGVQVQAGVTGLGLPSRDVQFSDGAGDGARFRSMRVLPRDIDLPLFFEAESRSDLKTMMAEFARVVSGECTLRWVDDEEVGSWYVHVHLVGGGDYTYGTNTVGETDAELVITLRAPDPFWTRSFEEIKTVSTGGGSRGLLNGSLANMKISSGQAIGVMTLENTGDTDSFPTWIVYGPGSDFKAVDPITGRSLNWVGTLAAGDVLTLNSETGTVTDQTGANRYVNLAPAPLFWRIPPGTHDATVSMEGTATGSRIECLWRPRKWLVI